MSAFKNDSISRRRLVQLSAATSGALALGTASSPANVTAQEATVRFLHNETDPPSTEFFNNAIEDFEADNPDIDIEMEAVSTDGRLQKITADLAAGTVPDLFKILPEERFEFARQQYLEPLDDVLESIGPDDFVPGSIARVDGTVYDLPYTVGNWGVLWYRSDLYEEKGLTPPTNWDELRACAEAFADDDINGIVLPAGNNRMTSIWFTQLLWSAGGTYFDADFNVVFDSQATRDTLQLMKDLAAHAPDGIASYSYSEVVDSYLSGQAAMTIYAPRLIARVVDNAPDLFPVTQAAEMPTGPAAAVKLIATNSFAIGTPDVGTQYGAEAKQFLEFLITGERSRDFSLTAFPHLIPPLQSVQDDLKANPPEMFADRPELIELAFDTSNGMDFDTEAGASFTDGVVETTGDLNPYMGAIIARHVPANVVQRVLLQGASPEEAAAAGAEEMQAIVDDLRN